MKCFLTFLLFFLSLQSIASTYTFRTQTCLSYIANGTIYPNCGPQEEVVIVTKEVAPYFHFGQWSKTIEKDGVKVKVLLTVVEKERPSGELEINLEGGIKPNDKLAVTINSKYVEGLTDSILTYHEHLGDLRVKPVFLYKD